MWPHLDNLRRAAKERLVLLLEGEIAGLSKEKCSLVAGGIASLVGITFGCLCAETSLLPNDSSFIMAMGIDTKSSLKGTQLTLGFVSIFYIGMGMGALLSFPICDAFGRRSAILFSVIGLIILIIWGSIFSARSSDMQTVRMLIGILMGIVSCAAPIYLSEISPGHQRGQVCSIFYFTKCLGIFISSTIFCLVWSSRPIEAPSLMDGSSHESHDAFLSTTSSVGSSQDEFNFHLPISLRLYMLIPLIPAVLASLLLPLIPESPRWLLAHKTPAECLDSLRWLRRTKSVNAEFTYVYQALSSDARQEDSWIELFSNRSLRYRLLVCCFILPVSQQMVGLQIVTTYMYPLSRAAHLNFAMITILIALFALVGASVAFRFVDIVGRKPLLCWGFLCISVLWVLGSYCAHTVFPFTNGIVPFFSLCFLALVILLISFSYSFSIGCLAWIIPVELFPIRARSRAVALSISANAAWTTVSALFLDNWWTIEQNARGDEVIIVPMKSLSSLIEIMLFLSFSSCCACFILYLALPETMNLMLEDMEGLFCMDAYPYACMPFSCEHGCIGQRTLLKEDLPSMVSPAEAASGAISSSKQDEASQTTAGSAFATGGVLPAHSSSLGTHSSLGGTYSRQGTPDGLSGVHAVTSTTSSVEFIQPHTLHKYSKGMRESNFTFFFHNAAVERDPLLASSGQGLLDRSLGDEHNLSSPNKKNISMHSVDNYGAFL
jgi:MFS family permease